jgi:hypothetical protein
MIQLPKNAHIWLPGLLTHRLRRARMAGPKRVWVMIGDHYEPLWMGATESRGADRVSVWRRRWPEIAAQFHDSVGNHPKYTFFFPQEEYRPQFLDPLAEMTEAGIADVEIHIHHDGEGARDFIDRMSSFINVLSERHGLLRQWKGRPAFGFIHGNWALDNSRPDGRWCGLNNEISLLVKLGCYADFTEPSAPNATQVHMVNSIYWAKDNPGGPKSHDRGIPLEPGSPDHPDDLLLITGPLGLRWGNHGGSRPWLPRLDSGEICSYDPPTPARIQLWLENAPQIGDDLFIKLFTHGAQERHADALLRGGLESLYSGLLNETKRRGMQVYFASAWEMRLAVEAVRKQECPVKAVLRYSASPAVGVGE